MPDPTYELTISEVVIVEESVKANMKYGNTESRIWQYSEIKNFTASATPENDVYNLTLNLLPIFYPDSQWLEHVLIYDEDGNYYSAGITGDDHQLHYDRETNSLTWNPTFNQYPEYFGMEFEEPLIIAPNKTLYFEYATNSSWTEAIVLEEANINLDSVRVIYDYNYLLKPEHYEWYASLFTPSHSYENIAYSFKDEVEYRVVQYYYEAFTVYSESGEYTHTFDLGDLSLETDFVNVSIFEVVGITPTLEFEILSGNNNFSIQLNTTTNQLTITDLYENDGLLNVFDQITAILNFSYGPISSYSEVYLLNEFNQTYLEDWDDTFYDYIDIDYSFLSESGTALIGEGSSLINSEYTAFKSIDFCRNPDMNTASNQLIGYETELFDAFEIYYNPSSVIYVADIDMDGESEYKHELDLNSDGIIDVVRYGMDDPQGSGDIIWHTILQDYENDQANIQLEEMETQRTKWFDLNDRELAYYDFNVIKLLLIVLTLPLVTYHISKMMFPDVDYWAQKSVATTVRKDEYAHSDYYSLKFDNDHDGIPDVQIDYEKVEATTYYQIDEERSTIMAAKYQDIFTYLGEYIVRSIGSLFKGRHDDYVFNDLLTEYALETGDYSQCTLYTQLNAIYLDATYRKFTEYWHTSYVDTVDMQQITITEYDKEGDIEEERVYYDQFENFEPNNVEDFFSETYSEHTITDLNTGEQTTVTFDPELPYTHPANITWQGPTWGVDNIPLEFDALDVIVDDSITSSNVFEETILLRIPNRYSLYDDYLKSSKSRRANGGWTILEATGVLISPPDGMVYYTSDAESFAAGRAKTNGFYFYVDSDLNGFYETVYIVGTRVTYEENEEDTTVFQRGSYESLGKPIYTVISIGLNYDGVHDFAPYEPIHQADLLYTDYSTLAHESAMFGLDWVYNFANLRNKESLKKLIWGTETDLEKLGLKPKDYIFEIRKLVDVSDHNKEFSELFYEVRHQAYAEAWNVYREQLARDIINQVFMSVTAATLSATVESMITGMSMGYAYALGKLLGALTYFAVYSLMTKFFIDIQMQEADAIARSETFYPESNSKVEPHSLNERATEDRILKDTMFAALIGHPGGYYTTVSGGEPGNMYTAELLVSPPNSLRMQGSFGGFLTILWENLLNMGGSDPDAFTALDFDTLNLDYVLFTSELPAFNYYANYEYPSTSDHSNLYNQYCYNTLGYLESKVSRVSHGQLDTIWATCVDGAPTYQFVNSSTMEMILPQEVLYRPIVLSEGRYAGLDPNPAELIVRVQCHEYEHTAGINAYDLTDLEQSLYAAKIPINKKSFEYPLRNVTIDVVVSHTTTNGTEIKYYAKDLVVNTTYYTIDGGSLYFAHSLEAIITESYPGFGDALGWLDELVSAKIYYKVHIIFDRFVPNISEETNRLALAQSTSYAIMDYFNQYTYAQVSAQMISEICYTETVTFWSTLISLPLIYFGSGSCGGLVEFIQEAGKEGVKSALKSFAKEILKAVLKVVIAPTKEVFQEIIMDGLIEALAENLVDMAGGTEDLGFWISSLSTSARELGGPLGKITLGKGVSLRTSLSLWIATKHGDMDLALEIKTKIEEHMNAKKQGIELKHEEQNKWLRLLKSDIVKGLFMLPVAMLNGLSFLAVLGAMNLAEGSIDAKLYSRAKAWRHAQAIEHIPLGMQHSIDSVFAKPLTTDQKQNAELDTKKSEIIGKIDSVTIPFVPVIPSINPNPMQSKSSSLLSKFTNLRSNLWTLNPSTQGITEVNLPDGPDITQKLRVSGITPTLTIENSFTQYPKEVLNYLYEQLFNLDSDLATPEFLRSKIFYDTHTFSEGFEFLGDHEYEGHQIIVDEAVNPEVVAILAEKYTSGEKFTALENLIATTACVLMGKRNIEGKVNSASDFLGNSFENTEQNYARLKVLSESMAGIPELQPGAEVPMRLMSEGTQYEKGDIIVFYQNEVKIVHRVEHVYTFNGETFYVTEGVNPETNPLVDISPVSGKDIIGIVDLSAEAFITIEEILKNRFVPFYTAYGMPSSTQEKPLKYLSYFKRAQELVNFFSKGIKPQSLTDREARLWYLRQEYKMRDMLDHSLSLNFQAVQAFYLRNCLRSKARDLMMNQKLAEYLRRNDKNYNWDQMVQRTEDKGFTGSGIWREIIESSMRSRQEANDELGVSGWEVYNCWWRYFKIG